MFCDHYTKSAVADESRDSPLAIVASTMNTIVYSSFQRPSPSLLSTFASNFFCLVLDWPGTADGTAAIPTRIRVLASHRLSCPMSYQHSPSHFQGDIVSKTCSGLEGKSYRGGWTLSSASLGASRSSSTARLPSQPTSSRWRHSTNRGRDQDPDANRNGEDNSTF